jgi:hypothetical protein
LETNIDETSSYIREWNLIVVNTEPITSRIFWVARPDRVEVISAGSCCQFFQQDSLGDAFVVVKQSKTLASAVAPWAMSDRFAGGTEKSVS